VVALNAAVVFQTCSRTRDIKDGIELARTLLREGRVAAAFERARQESHG
jgi:anthranilate phosphoribosyltransferase